MDPLTETMRNIRLGDGPGELEQLLFRPPEDSASSEKALDDIPRYLFRVVSPRSNGETNSAWVRSESACRNTGSSTEDIFFCLDTEKRTTIARTLNLHFRWWSKQDLEDNFVSWTSSLLSAIQYIYYRHLSDKDGSSLEDIKLYAIDTTRFPRGTFMRDLDLIDAFCEADDHPPTKNLDDLRSMRSNISYYFGEYLSQGSLKIENKCQMISAESLFEDDRLRRLQPQFTELHSISSKNEKPKWAKEVVRLREIIWPLTSLPQLSSAEMRGRMQAVEEIVDNLAPDWRLPLAIYFAALIGSESVTEGQETANDNVFFAYFRSVSFDEGRQGLRPPNFNVIAPDTMPELKQVKKFVREIFKDFQLRQALAHVHVAEVNIRDLHIGNVFSEHGSAFIAADSNEVLARAGQTVLSKLCTIQMLCKTVVQAISQERG